jgi:hypothetical protein
MQVFGYSLDLVSWKARVVEQGTLLTGKTGGNTVESKALRKLTIDKETITTSLCRPTCPPGTLESIVSVVGRQSNMMPNEGQKAVLSRDRCYQI